MPWSWWLPNWYIDPRHYREDVRSSQAAGPLTYSRFVPARTQWMYGYDHIKSKVLLEARPRSEVYVPKRNKDRWTRPYEHYEMLSSDRQRANQRAIIARTIPLSSGLVNPHPYIWQLPASQKKMRKFQQSSRVSNWSNSKDPSSTVHAVAESRFNPCKYGTQAWRHTDVSPCGFS